MGFVRYLFLFSYGAVILIGKLVGLNPLMDYELSAAKQWRLAGRTVAVGMVAKYDGGLK